MKIPLILILSVLLLFPFVIHSRFSVQDVECLTGDDFVQLHFKADRIIPIPDIFYPQKDNYQFIVMRINDIDFDIPQSQLKFESPVIQDVRIVEQKDFVDVEITLKEKVNYRVFTNQNGIYMEFPNVRNIKSPAETSADAGNKPAVAQTRKTAESIRKTLPEPDYRPINPVQAGGKSSVHYLQVVEKDGNHIRFHCGLSRKTEYRVIPIPEKPVRLAVDLINTRSRRIMENINWLNVNTIRGAYNSPEVYRLVFDLDYLKNYSVQLKDNILEISFFDGEKPEEVALADKQPEAKTENPKVDKPSEPPKETFASISPTELAARKKSSSIQNLDAIQDDPVKTQGDGNLNSPAANEVTEAKGQKVNPVSPKTEFFSEEKSQVSKDDYTENYMNSPEGEEEPISGNEIIKKTIAEGEKKYAGEPMDFNFKDADLNNVLLFFAKISGLNFLIDPNVSGKVTASMIQVPWDQALEYFLRVNKLDMVQEGNIIRVGRVDVLAKEANERRRLREAREMEGNLEVFTVPLSYAKVSEVLPILKKYLSQRGEIVEDKRTNQLIITDITRNRPTIDKLIETLDLPTRQVQIEARIVEVKSNYQQQFGIQWGFNFLADSSHGNQTTLSFPNSIAGTGNQEGGYAINLPAPAQTSGALFSFGNVANTFRLDMALSAMQKDGAGRILSAPKATTQDNQQATIQQGSQIPVQTIQNNTVTTRYVPAALELRVTPQITAEGTIITKIFITNNTADFANLVQGIPPIKTQKMETTVMVKDGGTIVIGGLYQISEDKTVESTPLLSRIPILGSLFKNKQKKTDKYELLIFITPRIIK